MDVCVQLYPSCGLCYVYSIGVYSIGDHTWNNKIIWARQLTYRELIIKVVSPVLLIQTALLLFTELTCLSDSHCMFM